MSAYVTLAISAALLLLFFLLASRDLFILFYSPVKGMGPGIFRIWAVARTTMLEIWNHRVWMVVPIQIIVSIVLILAIRPFDETERIPLYLRVLLTSQEIIVLLVFWVMACVSLPRERFFKIVITNISKPISRLEILLGKMLGFISAALLLLMVMGATSYIILLVSDNRIRANAQEEFTRAQSDFHTKNAKLEEAVPPPESLKRLAEEGSLFAYNYISAPKEGFAIVGNVHTTPTGLDRYIKGGSSEQAIYTFFPNLVGEEFGDVAPPGQRPFFRFFFPVIPLDPSAPPPPQIFLNVTAVRAKQRLRPQSRTIVLDLRKGALNEFALWEPEDPTDLFSFPGERDNGEIELTVTCQTEGVYLQILDGLPRDKLAAATPTTFNVIAFPGRGSPAVEVPKPNPVIRGFERHDKQQIAGPSKKELQRYGASAPLECAIFRFPAESITKVPIENGKFKLSMMLDVDKESNQDADTLAWLEVYNSDAPDVTQRFDLQNINVIEKRETIVEIPKKFLGNEDPSKRGEFVVILRCQTSGHWLAMQDDSVRIEKPAEPFVLNLVKSEIVLLCEASLLIVICVAWSVLLGWPVAMLTSAVCLFFGFMRNFINELRDVGGLGALGFPNFGVQSGAYKFFDNILAALWWFLGFLASLLPDFSKFDSLFYITQLRNMPADVLFTDIAWALAYTVPFIALGYLFFRKQELG